MAKIKCAKCGKELGMLSVKHASKQGKGKWCSQCLEEYEEQEEKLQKEHEIKVARKAKERITMLPKYEYHLESFSLPVGGLLPNKHTKRMNDLGKEGWELVSMTSVNMPVVFTSVPVTKHFIASFKRPL